MSDSVVESAHPGTLSPRNVDTVRYKVLKKIPIGIPVGDVFAWWPQGEVFGNINGGLTTTRNSDIAEWLANGLVERV